MERTTEQVAYDALIEEIKELRDNTPKHSMSDNTRALASATARTLNELAVIANNESGFSYKFDWSDFNEPLQDSVNDAFHLVDLVDENRDLEDPNKEHRHGHREYGLEGA